MLKTFFKSSFFFLFLFFFFSFSFFFFFFLSFLFFCLNYKYSSRKDSEALSSIESIIQPLILRRTKDMKDKSGISILVLPEKEVKVRPLSLFSFPFFFSFSFFFFLFSFLVISHHINRLSFWISLNLKGIFMTPSSKSPK